MSENEAAVRPADSETAHAEDPPPSWFLTQAQLWLLRPVAAAPGPAPLVRRPPLRRRQVPHAVLATVVMALAWLGVWVGIDRWEFRPDPQFFVDDIPLFAWYGLGIVALAALLTWRSRSTPAFAAVLALTLGAVPAPLLLFTLAGDYMSPSWYLGAMILTGVYTLLYLAQALRAITGESQLAAALSGLLFIAAFSWITDRLNVIPDVWTAPEARAVAPADASDDGEAILFGQSAHIDQALAAIPIDTTAKPRAFFVGFAGVGDQKVFAQEIGLASRVLGERYAIDGRRLSLLNDERDLERAPLASVSGLKYALHGLAARMNLDRDVLFLSISSHGAEDAAIAVANAQLPLKDLTDEDLADALRDSGIQWRVIIISACYAGAFIDSLRDPQTIVIAAAAADRTSFGCSNDRDLTYFGEAFYRDALPSAPTLRQAFDAAKASIAARERLEHVTASDPQAFFGQKMQAKLAAMDAAEEPAQGGVTLLHRK